MMPTGVYVRSPVRSRWKYGQELIDLTEASKILCLSLTGVHWQIKKKGALKLKELFSCRWWVLKSDVLEMKDSREKKAKESAIASHRHHLEKMCEWHSRMSKEGRCHWCGKPSCSEYKNACKEHLELSRGTNKYLKEQQRKKRMARRYCTECGRRPARYGYCSCALCGAIKAAYNRRRREQRKDSFFDYIEDKGLIDVDEVASILGVHRVSVHHIIKSGVLLVRHRGWRKFWLSKADVLAYKSD